MILVWLQRLIFLALIVIGALFALENRHSVIVHLSGDTYSISAYLLFFVLLSLGVIGGAFLSRLSSLVKTNKKKQQKAKSFEHEPLS